MDTQSVINYFYPEDDALRRMLLKHSTQVRNKALEILAAGPETLRLLDVELIADGAMLHDIGIRACHAPGIGCTGEADYIQHGVIGARMIRSYGVEHNMNLEAIARICERHTGSGITAREIREEGLPLEERDYLPETPEEQLICVADKFFSKSGDMREKDLARIRHSMQRFGSDSLTRFDRMCARFEVK